MSGELKMADLGMSTCAPHPGKGQEDGGWRWCLWLVPVSLGSGQDQRACPPMGLPRNGGRVTVHPVSSAPAATFTSGEVLGPPSSPSSDAAAFAWCCLLPSWAPHPLSCIRSLPPQWGLSPACPGLAKVSLCGPGPELGMEDSLWPGPSLRIF